MTSIQPDSKTAHTTHIDMDMIPLTYLSVNRQHDRGMTGVE